MDLFSALHSAHMFTRYTSDFSLSSLPIIMSISLTRYRVQHRTFQFASKCQSHVHHAHTFAWQTPGFFSFLPCLVSLAILSVHLSSVQTRFSPDVHLSSVQTRFSPGVHLSSVQTRFSPDVHLSSVQTRFSPDVHLSSVSKPGSPPMYTSVVYKPGSCLMYTSVGYKPDCRVNSQHRLYETVVQKTSRVKLSYSTPVVSNCDAKA